MEKKFNIFTNDWTLDYVDEVPTPEGDEHYFWFGLTDPVETKISVATKDKNGKPFSKKQLTLTTLHELFHAMLIEGGYLEINDEHLVEWLAKCTYSLMEQGIIKKC